MHKYCYASGFIYHPPTQKILLQQNKSASNSQGPWLFLGSICKNENKVNDVFKAIIYKTLRLKIKVVYPIYTYLQNETKTNHSIIYAKTQRLQNFAPRNNMKFAWFTFKQALKLQLSEQIKHDLTVSQRVVDAATRKRLGLHTL